MSSIWARGRSNAAADLQSACSSAHRMCVVAPLLSSALITQLLLLCPVVCSMASERLHADGMRQFSCLQERSREPHPQLDKSSCGLVFSVACEFARQLCVRFKCAPGQAMELIMFSDVTCSGTLLCAGEAFGPRIYIYDLPAEFQNYTGILQPQQINTWSYGAEKRIPEAILALLLGTLPVLQPVAMYARPQYCCFCSCINMQMVWQARSS